MDKFGVGFQWKSIYDCSFVVASFICFLLQQ
jgi:hypothetical protein